jgi:hypothetical protein
MTATVRLPSMTYAVPLRDSARHFDSETARLGLVGVTLHTLQHFTASRLLAVGTHTNAVQGLLAEFCGVVSTSLDATRRDRAPYMTWSHNSCVVILSGSSTCCMTLRELSCGRCSAAFLPGCGARGW